MAAGRRGYLFAEASTLRAPAVYESDDAEDGDRGNCAADGATTWKSKERGGGGEPSSGDPMPSSPPTPRPHRGLLSTAVEVGNDYGREAHRKVQQKHHQRSAARPS